MGTWKTNKWIKNLLILYVVSVIVRYVCALLTSSFPTVGIDEFLYYSLGRSIATEGKLLFRGQNANYAYILYPLVIAPIYLIFNGVNFYRLIQLWNIILMSTSVFPLFYLGKAILKSEKKAFFFTLVSMILPDFILGQLIFAEAILYPLFFTLMYCVYAYFQNGAGKYLLWSGLIGGLLYSTKPGAITPAVVFILFVLYDMIRKKERKGWIYILGSVLILAVVIIAFMLLARYGFGYRGSALSIYEQQIGGNDQGLHLGRFFRALVVYPYYFILACGIIGFVYPVYCYGRWNDELKRFWWVLIVSIGAMIIGSAWAVERTTSLINVNIRYVAMYIPLMLLFCCIKGTAGSDDKTANEQKLQWLWPAVIIGFTALCTLILRCKAGSQTVHFYALMSLSVFNNRVLPLTKQFMGDVIILMLCAALFFLFSKRRKHVYYETICMRIMILLMLVNNALCYSYIHVNYRPEDENDGVEVSKLTQGKPYLYVITDEGYADFGVDVSSKGNNCFVFANDFIDSLQKNDGIYKPYLPQITRGMADVHETPDVDTLVVDFDSYPMLKLSEYTTVSSPEERGHVNVVHFTPGKRLADSSMSNIITHLLTPNKPGILLIYDEEMLGRPLTVRMDIYSEAAQTMSMNSTHELYTTELSEGRDWYEITFNKAEDAFNFKVPDKNIKVYSYELISPEE